MRTQSSFAAAIGRNKSTVSRWEDGQSVTADVVHLYEEALSLRGREIFSAIEYLHRQFHPVGRDPALQSRASDGAALAAGEILDLVLSDAPMPARTWELLSRHLAHVAADVIPRRDWDEIWTRLAAELELSRGVDYPLRWTAACRMAGIPKAAASLLEYVEACLNGKDRPLFGDLTSLVEYANHPSALSLLMTSLGDDDASASRWAVLLAAGGMVRRGTVSAERQEALLSRVIEILCNESESVRTRRAAAGIVGSLAGQRRTRLAAGLNDLVPSAAWQAVTVLEESLLSRQLRDEFVRACQSQIESSGYPYDDPVFVRLMAGALSDAFDTDRGTCLGVLSLVPQRQPIAAACMRLAREHRGETPILAVVLGALTWLAGPQELDALTTLALSEGLDPASAFTAAVAVAHCVASPSPEENRRDQRFANACLAAPAGQAAGFTYALAMRGRYDLLIEVRSHAIRESKASLATGADWYLDVPKPWRVPHVMPAQAPLSRRLRRPVMPAGSGG